MLKKGFLQSNLREISYTVLECMCSLFPDATIEAHRNSRGQHLFSPGQADQHCETSTQFKN
jgi:hypothetical protein